MSATRMLRFSDQLKRVAMRPVTRDDLREDLFGNERRSAHVIHAELHVRALVIGIEKARDDVLDAEQALSDFGDHQVRVV